jgi:hypothetical protein
MIEGHTLLSMVVRKMERPGVLPIFYAFSYESFASSFYILGLYFFGARISTQKAALKMLVKLTPGCHT